MGGSAIEASKIAGHSDLEMTGEYTIVTAGAAERTRRIQEKIAVAGEKNVPSPASVSIETPAALADTLTASTFVQ